MARYRKIDPRIWNDIKFRALSDESKLVFLFVLTHPHLTSLGAMRASVPGLAAELGWKPEAFREAFREALAKGLLEHDETASFVWAPRFLRYNGPESPNVVKSWVSSLDLLPECKLKDKVVQQVNCFVEALPEAFRKALPEAFAKSMPNQEQEQEQEQEQQREGARERATPSPECGIKKFLDLCREAGEKPIPADGPVFAYAESIKLPSEFLFLAFREFVDRMEASGKRYKGVNGWRRAFLTCVRANWYKLWFINAEGDVLLTTTGQQAQRAHEQAKRERIAKERTDAA